jgi:hypothetical protein
MRFSFQPSISRALALFSLLGLGFVQVGCAHPVVVEPSVVVSSRIGHFPVYAQVGVPAPVVVMPSPRVIYAPPPPPRVIYAPQVYGPVYGVGRGHDRRHDRLHWGHDRRHPSHDEGRWDHRDGGHR